MGEWHGVTTNDAWGASPTLGLGENELNGEVPAELGNLTNLTELYLNDNQLTGEIPSELGNLTNLTVLFLRKQRVERRDTIGAGQPDQSHRVVFSHDNQLVGEIPWELGNLTNLNWLYLDYNQLSGEIPWELGNLTNLKWLIFRQQPVDRRDTIGTGQPDQSDRVGSPQATS